jgi:cytochrome c-type biogenesis protein CcmH
MKKLVVLILIFLIILNVEIALATSLKDVESDVICPCGCYRVLSNCDCEVAEEARGQIGKMVDSGMEKKEIISRLQLLYGKEILANPPKEGFFMSLWIYPAIITVCGIVIVYLLIRRRNSKWYYDPDEVINEEIDLDEIYEERSR